MDYNDLNLGNSVFQGFNDKYSLMLCGYEWGFSKDDQQAQESGEWVEPNEEVKYTFANKAQHWGDVANTWRYDHNIKKWFELWGFPLDSQKLDDDFEKSIVQTNWADTQSHSIAQGTNKFLSEEQIDNFINHITALKPKVIIFMGRKLIDYLQNPAVFNRFVEVMGEMTERKRMVQKKFSGTRFKIFFQNFENCQIVCFPHPSGSRGLRDDYIASFRPEMNEILSTYKSERSFI